MRFDCFGIRVKINYSFLLIIAFSLLLNNSSLIYVLLFSALHEAGHLIILYILKGKADSITFSFYGVGLKHSSRLGGLHEIFFLFGGITVNAVFCIINVHREVNLPLLLVNALPLYPLDGGRITKLVLNRAFSLEASDRLFKINTAVFLILFTAYAIYLKNVSLLLISSYILIYSINNSFD